MQSTSPLLSSISLFLLQETLFNFAECFPIVLKVVSKYQNSNHLII